MKVPGIEDLVKSSYNDLIQKKLKLKDLENDPNYNIYPIQIDIWEKCSVLKNDINRLEESLIRFKSVIREDKLNQLGI
jgi:hypothetical protein